MTLREIRKEDLLLILQWRNHPAVRSCMFSQEEIAYEDHQAWFEREKQKKDSKWLLFLGDANTPLGVVSITKIDNSSKHAFWGFYANPEAPKGTGKIMCMAAINYCFSDLNLHKINAEVLESNVRSQELHKRLDFKIEGIFKDHFLSNDKFESVIRFAKIRNK
ncbi:UDP-4-amino-4,6-dideoxy-N-acetyl-beta-L-altrosamine N-acetyltransferase [Alcaligenes nematophilus]|jgi:UDP-4-amino-4,6-dideoxy-N-acetyl-beta-L-altrosamine N-acetyltransferase|uniref:UDP-4-amino-4, 6-dideoxy-N-acetyl-beta-L-altrosamine N-acetyltransferase n=1 Tax=Alcaligenes phenolicus TaxID=232846 RepID=A0AAW5W0T2_9BURK|nr:MULTISPECIES: UDP-4-amino-4,6-dideoxy-N-acetyl-beta-L-altrosamine N-acetyltransferase [Alcaligenes]MCX5567117.1 UDP-4-amino-4,6-dideoxy-N-acetyl-beta-L-altrosamine N-acetyltransferase [Alcaligenes phenolicus]MDH4867579.1 UDP-4-amino-4,6-dideoxy-N-acetyl-beta-L-altrosamine N-acetyltransferase [Bacillus cereus]MDY7128887.1 UDP-4-amino-4,6-dideoxy-N-acetyl-beta-L-altrosamine N-acetyltransferase [Alcaligenes nematophilus]